MLTRHCSQGIAFTDIKEGDYLPAVSLYRGGKVSMNFGPHFKHNPESLDHRTRSCIALLMCANVALAAVNGWKPYSVRADEYAAESAMRDLTEQALFKISIKDKVEVS